MLKWQGSNKKLIENYKEHIYKFSISISKWDLFVFVKFSIKNLFLISLKNIQNYQKKLIFKKMHKQTKWA